MENKPQITKSEIQDWENKFKENVSPLVQFENDGTANGSMKLYNGKSGYEAIWAGTIMLNKDNYIKWSFSIQNEPFIDIKCNFNDNNYKIITNLKNFYDSWKTEWSKQLSIPNSDKQDINMSTNGAPESIKTEPIQNEPVVQENERTKIFIIKNHKERMQKLSGLR